MRHIHFAEGMYICIYTYTYTLMHVYSCLRKCDIHTYITYISMPGNIYQAAQVSTNTYTHTYKPIYIHISVCGETTIKRAKSALTDLKMRLKGMANMSALSRAGFVAVGSSGGMHTYICVCMYR